MKTARHILIFLFLTLFLLQPIRAAATGPVILTLTIDGAITPATQEYLKRGLDTAAQRNAEAVILQLNTPGGGLDSMQKMAEAMRASVVPVVVYVTPRGAWRRPWLPKRPSERPARWGVRARICPPRNRPK